MSFTETLTLALKKYKTRKEKIVKGWYRTKIKNDKSTYNPDKWWDDSYYTSEITDQKTINKENKNKVYTKNHYSSIEKIITSHLYNNDINNKKDFIDIGSGAGHWIHFYRSIGYDKCIGIDISKDVVDCLSKRFKNNGIEIKQGKAVSVLEKLDMQVDLVNAIGIMFHITDDEEWEQTIEQVYSRLRKGGLFIVSGNIGFVNGVNVQYHANEGANKRLRSKRNYESLFNSLGFSDVRYYYNTNYLFVKDNLPESNIIIAKK